MKLEKLKPKVEKAIESLLKNDLFLLEIKAHERSVAHKLAEYLQQEFSEYHVDCEYNRDKDISKRLKNISECKNDQNNNSDLVYPDIIIHRRNTDNNLLVIEIKTSSNSEKCDIKKLELFTDLSEKFKYKFGLFLKFDCKRLVDDKWYEDGDFKQMIKVKSFVWYDENREENNN